jgi:glycosyltransferase involved in cell wall biosynthesis
MARALVEFAGRGWRVRATIVSPGPLRAAVQETLRGRVAATFIDHLPQARLGNLYRAADVFVLTSLGEGWNQATVEAMACGLPVVVTDVPGVRDVAGGCGLFVPPRRPDLVADALERIAGDDGLRRELIALALERCRRLTWQSVARLTISVYQRRGVLDSSLEGHGAAPA